MDAPSRVDYWNEGWHAQRTEWHRSKVNQSLLKYYGKITGGQKALQFFVPLCGKSIDMRWLSDHGQHVVGVEGVQIACEQFFQEQNLKYSTSDISGIPNGKLYTAESENIKIYQCDAFLLTSEITGKFDVIWDRGSLVAVNPGERAGYVKMLQKVSKPGTRILAEVYEYDFEEKIGKFAPYPLFRKDVDNFFETWCSISEEHRYNKIDENPRFREWGLSWMTNIVYLMKSNI